MQPRAEGDPSAPALEELSYFGGHRHVVQRLVRQFSDEDVDLRRKRESPVEQDDARFAHPTTPAAHPIPDIAQELLLTHLDPEFRRNPLEFRQ